MRRLLIVLVAAAALVVGCDYDNTGDYVIRDSYLCDVATGECEVLP